MPLASPTPWSPAPCRVPVLFHHPKSSSPVPPSSSQTQPSSCWFTIPPPTFPTTPSPPPVPSACRPRTPLTPPPVAVPTLSPLSPRRPCPYPRTQRASDATLPPSPHLPCPRPQTQRALDAAANRWGQEADGLQAAAAAQTQAAEQAECRRWLEHGKRGGMSQRERCCRLPCSCRHPCCCCCCCCSCCSVALLPPALVAAATVVMSVMTTGPPCFPWLPPAPLTLRPGCLAPAVYPAHPRCSPSLLPHPAHPPPELLDPCSGPLVRHNGDAAGGGGRPGILLISQPHRCSWLRMGAAGCNGWVVCGHARLGAGGHRRRCSSPFSC